MLLSIEAKKLLKEQLAEWELAQSNYQGLKKVKTKEFVLNGGAHITVQFNPERIRSSAAKVDAKSISKRPCFLCKENRPAEQRELPFNEGYSILVNPFPIFTEHFTIASTKHTKQFILPHFIEMLRLAEQLNDFIIFYNGPECGASAPDHFHFQAGIKGFMPIEEDYRNGGFTKILGKNNEMKLLIWQKYHRGIISFESRSSYHVNKIFQKLHELLKEKFQPKEEEPMLNILAYYENGRHIVHIFPRTLHRPACYFTEGNNQIILSPASVDMGGVFITPREEDFEKITADDIASILTQVCMHEKDTINLAKTLLKN